MSREYTIKLSEEEIDLIIHDIQFSINNDQENEISNSDRGEVIIELMVAKEKPYTNFDKIKNEITINKLARYYAYKTNPMFCIVKRFFRCGNDEVMVCKDCIEQWLESEVKE